jgi:HEAT repeat protein
MAIDARPAVFEEALFAATLAREAVIWPDLLNIAQNQEVDSDLRQQAVFWLGQLAGDKATEGLVNILEDDDEDLEVREHAIFALSHRDPHGCIPHLSRIACTSKHPQLREQALFWLAKIDDPRVLALFEKILLAE